jgi:hypothetical protein
MKFTREELEDIWNNEPYGYFTKLMKRINSGGVKRYTVCIKPYMLNSLDGKEITVYCSGIDTVEMYEAKNDLRVWAEEKYGKDIDYKFHMYKT